MSNPFNDAVGVEFLLVCGSIFVATLFVLCAGVWLLERFTDRDDALPPPLPRARVYRRWNVPE